MKTYIIEHPWKIIEEGFYPEYNRISESLFSIGNGRMGQRANFEERFTGDSLQGNYLAGIYFPDKTKVGWWKNGYPEYFAKVINSVNWIGIDIKLNGQDVDIAQSKIYDFRRELNMKEGHLFRSFTIKIPSGEKVKVQSTRFLSLVDKDIGVISYTVEALNFSGEISIMPYLDFDVVNEDSNYDEKFWAELEKETFPKGGYVSAMTKKLDFRVGAAMKFDCYKNGQQLEDLPSLPSERKKYVGQTSNVSLKEGDQLQVIKYNAIVSNFYYTEKPLKEVAYQKLEDARQKGFGKLLEEQSKAWANNWKNNDIVIEGDIKAQQGIRYNIFQLYQTYTGDDERLNIGPKGFTGEKYGGSTYWDTEAYCLPFYMSTAGQEVAKNLLLYRYKHLPKAIENAQKLGFENGAALYPMVTMNGEECHNEWEITFEEIHRNGAIAYAIFNYVRYTGDDAYLKDYGLEVLIAISRFWSQRSQYSAHSKCYMILGVTGPNEYENNVNNNWYTNYIARWCLEYTLNVIDQLKDKAPDRLAELFKEIDFKELEESNRWKDIISNMHLPKWQEKGVQLQQDGFLDKQLSTVDTLSAEDIPLNQNWSWDRILRSCFIKQADVLQGYYFFENHFSKDALNRNFEFYEPMTVHESSLSPCIHSVLAASLGKKEKAYEMYLRTARLDLEDYNNDTDEGCHITSMAGTWMAIVEGFGGKRVSSGKISFYPMLPDQWESYSFRLLFRGASLELEVNQKTAEIRHLNGEDVEVELFERSKVLKKGTHLSIDWQEVENVKV
jgi:maltose phosphorylase